jgi:predicted SAM-dependent methyltransferase
MEKIKLHLGCGKRYIKNYINIDIQKSDTVDVVADIMDLPYKKNTVNLIYACSVLEHFGKNNNLNFFRNTSYKNLLEYWYSLLEPGGEIYIGVPNFKSVCEEYLEKGNLSSLLGFLVGGQKNEEDLHGMVFDFPLLFKTLSDIGFKNIQEYDWKEFEPFTSDPEYDDFSASYIPHMDIENGRLMQLNVKAIK